MSNAHIFLEHLNTEYLRLHKEYEDLYWISYMGDHSVDTAKDTALVARDVFRSDRELYTKTQEFLKGADAATKSRFKIWLRFFDLYQSPPEVQSLKNKISKLESKLLEKRAARKEGYLDPVTGKFVEASFHKMRTMRNTHDDERVRKACFEGCEKLAVGLVTEYIEIVRLRNEYAKKLGYSDFYAFKLQSEDGMTKKELVVLFDSIYEKTKFVFADIRKLEKKSPGLRKPWNFQYRLAGDFTKEEDPYFQFDDALLRWGRSFSALGIDFQKGKMQLDLMDRKGKWNNGFCHWPDLVHYKKGKRIPGSSNFTCNVVAGQVGSGAQGYNTLFHEGGHAAHFMNVDEREVALNHEYPPMTMSLAETQSMFLDTVFSSVEWKTRYAKDTKGNPYPFELYERKVRTLAPLRAARMHSILFVSNFERDIYETKTLTREKVLAIARKNYRKYFDHSEDSLYALNIPHINIWEYSGGYHGYGLAEIALTQWRAYFYKKYGYIVDNPNVGKEMKKMWSFGSRFTYKEFVRKATGSNPSAKALLEDMVMTPDKVIETAKKRIVRLAKVKLSTKPVRLNAKISMVHGKKEIANNSTSFEDMAEVYGKWVRNQAKKEG